MMRAVLDWTATRSLGASCLGWVLSCKQSGVDPDAYIEDLLGLVSTTPASRIAELTPWAWAERRGLAARA